MLYVCMSKVFYFYFCVCVLVLCKCLLTYTPETDFTFVPVLFPLASVCCLPVDINRFAVYNRCHEIRFEFRSFGAQGAGLVAGAVLPFSTSVPLRKSPLV